MREKTLVFQNRAWEKAEHPRYVSEVLKVSKDMEKVFEISYNYVAEKYYVETSEARIKEDGRKDTSVSWKYFDSLNECFDYIEKTYKVKIRVVK